MDKTKHLGQVNTPNWIVCEILDACDYAGSQILQRHILEPSCGDGSFLHEIVVRYIAAAQAEQWTNEHIAQALAQYIWGVEIDPIVHQQCLDRLNQLVAEKLGQVSVKWNIFQQDALDFYRHYPQYFDWIVGNPPYIRVHHLPEHTRDRLKREFRFTVGTTDMYLAFFEMAFHMLKPKGKMGFITPNSFLHNTSYQMFRQFLQQQGKLCALYDLKSHKVFESYATYTAISIFDNAQNQSDFIYYEWHDDAFAAVNHIAFAQLQSKKWVLSHRAHDAFLHNIQTSNNARLQDFFEVQYGLATLRDKIFIGQAVVLDEQLSLFQGMPIENAILRPIVKGSRYKGKDEEIQSIVFPYYLKNGRYIAYSEDELQQNFPAAYAYLLHHKEELLKRDLDKKAQWFEFGRSQGLQTIHQEKIVMSPLVNGQVNWFRLSAQVLVYSGLFITKKSIDVDWAIVDWAMVEQALSSHDFLHYARLTGKDMSGGYKSLSSKQIKHFAITLPAVQMSLFGE